MPDDGEDLCAPVEVLADAAVPSEEPVSRGMIEVEAGRATILVPLETDAAGVAELVLALRAH